MDYHLRLLIRRGSSVGNYAPNNQDQLIEVWGKVKSTHGWMNRPKIQKFTGNIMRTLLWLIRNIFLWIIRIIFKVKYILFIILHLLLNIFPLIRLIYLSLQGFDNFRKGCIPPLPHSPYKHYTYHHLPFQFLLVPKCDTYGFALSFSFQVIHRR